MHDSRADAADDKSHIESLVRTSATMPATSARWRWARRPDADLKLAFHDLRELKVDVAYPFLLELYHDYTS